MSRKNVVFLSLVFSFLFLSLSCKTEDTKNNTSKENHDGNVVIKHDGKSQMENEGVNQKSDGIVSNKDLSTSKQDITLVKLDEDGGFMVEKSYSFVFNNLMIFTAIGGGCGGNRRYNETYEVINGIKSFLSKMVYDSKCISENVEGIILNDKCYLKNQINGKDVKISMKLGRVSCQTPQPYDNTTPLSCNVEKITSNLDGIYVSSIIGNLGGGHFPLNLSKDSYDVICEGGKIKSTLSSDTSGNITTMVFNGTFKYQHPQYTIYEYTMEWKNITLQVGNPFATQGSVITSYQKRDGTKQTIEIIFTNQTLQDRKVDVLFNGENSGKYPST